MDLMHKVGWNTNSHAANGRALHCFSRIDKTNDLWFPAVDSMVSWALQHDSVLVVACNGKVMMVKWGSTGVVVHVVPVNITVSS